jgi:hypothetical protein
VRAHGHIETNIPETESEASKAQYVRLPIAYVKVMGCVTDRGGIDIPEGKASPISEESAIRMNMKGTAIVPEIGVKRDSCALERTGIGRHGADTVTGIKYPK